jgi:hypothetical protein
VQAWLAEPRLALKAFRQAARDRKDRPDDGTSEFAWWAWSTAIDNLEKRLEAATAFPQGDPVSLANCDSLRSAIAAVRSDLRHKRPW